MTSTTTIDKERWNEAEIKKVAKILLRAEKNKSSFVKVLDEIVHWLLILLVVFGNLIISVFLVFTSALIPTVYFYMLIIICALLFGLLIETPLRDIEKLDKNKHFISRVLLPLLALANIYIFIGIKASIEYYTKLELNVNALIAGVIYAVFFLVPHAIMMIVKKK